MIRRARFGMAVYNGGCKVPDAYMTSESSTGLIHLPSGIGLGVHIAQRLINRLSRLMAPMAAADSGRGAYFVVRNRGLG